jgi:hypothetical protein
MNFLRFPDESTWLTAASDAGFMAGDTLVAYTHDRAIDVVGTITGLAGFHVNYSWVMPTGWDEFLVAPDHPYRVFA